MYYGKDKKITKRRSKTLSQCLRPIIVKAPYDRKYGGNHFEEVPCGKCYSCLRKQTLQMQFRLEQEWKHHKFSAFCCLTYADEFLPLNDLGIGTLVKDHLLKFLRSMKDLVRRKYNDDFRFYAIGEYGTSDFCTHRPHYHFLYFTDSQEFHQNALNEFMHKWKLGRIDVGYCDSSSIGYITHDMMKELDTSKKRHNFIDGMYAPKWCALHKVLPPFATWSRHPFLGFQYLEVGRLFHTSNQELNSYVILNSGVKVALPKIYAEKYFGVKHSQFFSHQNWLARQAEANTYEETLKEIARELSIPYCERSISRLSRIFFERYDAQRVSDVATRTNKAKSPS